MAAFPADAAAAGVAPAGTTEGARPAADRTDGQATMHDVTSNVARVSSTPPIPNSRVRIFFVQKQEQCAMGKVRAHVACVCGEACAMRARDTPATRAPPARQHSPSSHACATHTHCFTPACYTHSAKPRIAPLRLARAPRRAPAAAPRASMASPTLPFIPSVQSRPPSSNNALAPCTCDTREER